MLGLGLTYRDVCYYIGEDVPRRAMTNRGYCESNGLCYYFYMTEFEAGVLVALAILVFCKVVDTVVTLYGRIY